MSMDTQSLLKKVRKIEIKSKGLSNHLFSGEYHSAFKGRGMAFSEVREYQAGDEIRTIDWNVTARFNHPYVKTFEEERELTVMILIDVSSSENFGTVVQQKKDLAVELCAVLAFSAISNNDKVGIIFFTDRVEKFIAPKKGRSHILQIIRELVSFEPVGKGTDVSKALEYFTRMIKKKCTAFLLSDFISPSFKSGLEIANKKHDVIALRVYDRNEQSFPDLGIVPVIDQESGESKWINTSSKRIRTEYAKAAEERVQLLLTTFSRAGVDFTSIGTHESYVKALTALFKKRENKR